MKYGSLLFFFLLSFSLSGQALQFLHHSSTDGAPSGTTLSFLQDQQGFLWLGTTDGLFRYDGKTFRAFYHNRKDTTSISNNYVKSIAQGQNGQIWLATAFGLNCYLPEEDRFVQYIKKDGKKIEAENNIHEVLVDRQGKVWYGTYHGLFQLNVETNSLLQFLPQEDNPNSINHDFVWTVFEDSRGWLWLGTQNGIAIYKNDGSLEFETYLPEYNKPYGLNTDRVWSFVEQPNGTIWLGAYNGIYKVDPSQQALKFQHFKHDPEEPNSLSHSFVESMMVEGNERLWVATWNGGLNELVFPKKNIDEIQFVHHRNNEKNPLSIGLDKVNSVYRDKSGILWVGTGSTLDKVVPSRNKFNPVVPIAGVEGSLNDKIIKSIVKDTRGNLWVGTRKGLHFLSAEQFENRDFNFTIYVHDKGNKNSLSNNNIFGLMEDSRGYLWISTYHGLNYVNLSTFEQKPHFKHLKEKDGIPSNFLYRLLEIDTNVYWLPTYGGLAKMYFDPLQPKNIKFDYFEMDDEKEDALVNSTTYEVCKDRFGHYWVATYDGLSKYVEKDGIGYFENYKHIVGDSTSLSNNRVITLHKDQKGRLWIGTRAGLNLAIQDNAEDQVKFRTFGRAEGFSNEVIQAIEEDEEGHLWLGTNYGLLDFDPDAALDGKTAVLKKYWKSDGLAGSNTVFRSSHRDQMGNLFFGSASGLSYFNPNNLIGNKHVPSVVFTELKILNKTILPQDGADAILKKAINLTDTICLKYDQNIISLKFAALDFANPIKNQYAHQLVGFDREWVFTGNENSVTYTNLPSGTYQLLVKGSNNDGLWNETPTRLVIKVLPPIWKTWWAYLFYFLSISTLVYTFIRMRMKQRIRKMEQAIQIEKARYQEREALRKQNAADFHDELGHRLTKISLFLELVQRQTQNNNLLSDYFMKIKKNTAALSDGIRDLIWSLDPEKDSLNQTLLRLQEFGDQLFDYAEIQFTTSGINELLANIQLEPDVRKHILLIFKEAMNNSLKYAKANAVKLEVEEHEQHYVICFEDDGIGFDLQETPKGYGLKNMHDRAEIINGRFKIESKKESGTQIRLTMTYPQ